jgi:hypothetical protein
MSMLNYFTLIYIKTNRFSNERFCVGVLANIDGIPYFGYSKPKLNIALNYTNKESVKSIKRSFGILENDVNRIINGKEALSLFDMPYSKKVLDKLTLKKRGLVQYSELFEIKKPVIFSKLYVKFIGEEFKLNTGIPKKTVISLKKRLFTFVQSKRYMSFKKRFKMTTDEFSSIYSPIIVDLVRKENCYTVFQTIDFSLSISTIQKELNKFRLIRQSFAQKSESEGMGKGRYYLVYEGQNNLDKRSLISKIKENSIGYELLRMCEMSDKL